MTAATIGTLVIYAYTSFTSSWGPGPTLAKKFESRCECKVELVNAGDGGELISRLKLEGPDTRADVVVGLDETLLPRIKEQLGWKNNFVAFDKGPYAFVYDSTLVKNPPHSLDDLLNTRWKGEIILEDPRLSTPGLDFLLWVIKEKGDGAWDYFKKLKGQIKLITPSWDLAYGLFKKGQGQLVFSYWTSPAYHIQEEHETKYKAARFRKGHYVQMEYLTAVPGEKNNQLKAQFIKFMLSPEAQEIIPIKNFMYPVTKGVKLPPAFEAIGTVAELAPLSEEQLKPLDEWLKKWREIFN